MGKKHTGKKTDKRPARGRYWQKGGPRERKIANLLKQVVCVREEITHYSKAAPSELGKARVMTKRTGETRPRFADYRAAMKFWKAHRRHMGRMAF